VRRKEDKELKMENLVESWKNSKQADKHQTKKTPHSGYHADSSPKTPTARRQPAK
jgi:hypothetical protein